MHPRIKQIIYTLVLASVCGAAWAVGGAGQYQWSVGLRGYVSAETGKEPQAFMWLPEGRVPWRPARRILVFRP